MDSGPHSHECSTAVGGTCHCECHGTQHGVVHLAKSAVSKITTRKLPGGGFEVRGPDGFPPGGGTKEERVAIRAAKVDVKANGGHAVEKAATTTAGGDVKRLPDAQHNALEAIAAAKTDPHRNPAARDLGVGNATVSSLQGKGYVKSAYLSSGSRTVSLTDKGHAYLAGTRGDKKHADLNAKIAETEAQAAQAHREHDAMTEKTRKAGDWGRTSGSRLLADQHARGLDAKAQQLRAERDVHAHTASPAAAKPAETAKPDKPSTGGPADPKRAEARLAALADSKDPKDNGAKIKAMIDAGGGHADLYRAATAGPSGQRANVHVGRLRYQDSGPYDFKVYDMSGNGGDHVGYLTRTSRGGQDVYSVTSVSHDGGTQLEGYTPSAAAGADMLVHDQHTAFGRHSSQRTSPATFTPFKPSTETAKPDKPAEPKTRPVASLARGDRAKIVGEDQYGAKTTLAGYVQGPPSLVRIREGRKVREALVVQVAEHPDGADGWRGQVYVPKDATAEHLNAAAPSIAPPKPSGSVKSTATHRPAEPLPTGPVASADELKMVDREVEKLPPGVKSKGRRFAAAVRAGDRREAKNAASDLTRALRDNGHRAEASRWVTVAERIDDRHQIRDTAEMIRKHPKADELPAFKSVTPDEVRKLGLHNATGGHDTPEDVHRRLVHLRDTGEVLPPVRSGGREAAPAKTAKPAAKPAAKAAASAVKVPTDLSSQPLSRLDDLEVAMRKAGNTAEVARIRAEKRRRVAAAASRF